MSQAELMAKGVTPKANTACTQSSKPTRLGSAGTARAVEKSGEPLDESQAATETEAYLNGVAQGCVVIPIQDLRQYFKF